MVRIISKRFWIGLMAAGLTLYPIVASALIYEITDLHEVFSLRASYWSEAWDINDHGHIVGMFSDSSAFYYDGENFEVIHFLNATATGINNQDEIAGFASGSAAPDGRGQNYIWRNGQTDWYANSFGQIVDINEDGELVERTPYSGPTDLIDWIPSDSGWVSLTPMAINSSGQIVGMGTRFNNTRARFDGHHAFLMNPVSAVPEPHIVFLLLTGLFGLCVRKKK